jgi:hypothetical protein
MTKNRMTHEELKILARTECLLVWDRISRLKKSDLENTGDFEYVKENIIKELYNNKQVVYSTYESSCPFCEYLRDLGKEDCIKCLWPGEGHLPECYIYARCTDLDSPFSIWTDMVDDYFAGEDITIKDLRKAGKAVFKLIWDTTI